MSLIQTYKYELTLIVGGLMSKGQVGVLLGEHRGWMLHMAFSYKAKAFRTTAFFPLFQHTIMSKAHSRQKSWKDFRVGKFLRNSSLWLNIKRPGRYAPWGE